MARSVNRTTLLEPWMIALIILAVVAILAVIIILLVYFLVYDQKMFFYKAEFRINNVPYDPAFKRQTSPEFREVSASIETLVNQAFDGTPLRKRMIKAHVVNLREDNGRVLANVVLVFRFIASDNNETLFKSVDDVLLKRLKSPTWPLSIDLSTYKLSGLSVENGQNLLYSCCGTRMVRPVERVFGGSVAVEGEWPWQASLQQDGVHRCGATLISNKWLVTAAHCFRGARDVKHWTTSFGARLRTPAMTRRLSRIIIHEQYANNIMNHEYDIAVVQISTAVEFTSAVHRVCLPEATQHFPENTTCYVTGWGALRNDGPSVNELRQTKVKIISNNICNRREVYHGSISPGMLCAGYLEGGSDACQGDSGGSLVTDDSRGIWYLVGIVSWGDECAKPNKPGVYTRVTYYRDWIAAHTGV